MWWSVNFWNAPWQPVQKKNSRCSDEGLAELCWRCWARALWWSLSLWSEECGNRTNQRIGCRDTQSVLSILYKIKRHTSHSVSCTEETGRTVNDTPGTKKNKKLHHSAAFLTIHSSQLLRYQGPNFWKECQDEWLPTAKAFRVFTYLKHSLSPN